ncbi:MAG: hypothetical protein WBX22_02650 [Silvibacterium sp.]
MALIKPASGMTESPLVAGKTLTSAAVIVSVTVPEAGHAGLTPPPHRNTATPPLVLHHGAAHARIGQLECDASVFVDLRLKFPWLPASTEGTWLNGFKSALRESLWSQPRACAAPACRPIAHKPTNKGRDLRKLP